MKEEKVLATMTLHEQTKEIVKDLPPFTKAEWEEIRSDLSSFVFGSPGKVFMLLSNEIRYYTLFEVETRMITQWGIADRIIKFIREDEFLKTLGTVKVFKRTGNGEMEIWIGETHFLLFEADSFFVKI